MRSRTSVHRLLAAAGYGLVAVVALIMYIRWSIDDWRNGRRK